MNEQTDELLEVFPDCIYWNSKKKKIADIGGISILPSPISSPIGGLIIQSLTR